MKTLKMLLLLLVAITLSGCDSNENKHSAKEWAMMAVEEHYILDDGNGHLLTHTAVIQTPSLEFVEEVEGKTYGDYLYVEDADGDYYMAFFKHYLVVETYNHIEEYVYISAIAWEDEIIFYDYEHAKFSEQQILDLDIGELTWN